MIKNMKIKKACVVLLLSIPVTGIIVEKHNKSYIKNDDRGSDIFSPYGYVGNKAVYIGEYPDNFVVNLDSITIIDHRLSDDPNYIVIDSYKVRNTVERLEVLKLLLEYNNEYVSEWDRSLLSMDIEWLIHNICYELDYEVNKTKDVDLNNADENLIKLFRNNFS